MCKHCVGLVEVKIRIKNSQDIPLNTVEIHIHMQYTASLHLVDNLIFISSLKHMRVCRRKTDTIETLHV